MQVEIQNGRLNSSKIFLVEKDLSNVVTAGGFLNRREVCSIQRGCQTQLAVRWSLPKLIKEKPTKAFWF